MKQKQRNSALRKIRKWKGLWRIRELRNQTQAHRLRVYNGFYSLSLKELKSCYNGVGPDSFPAWVRRFLTGIFQRIEAVFLDHDASCRYQADRSYFGFTKSNWRLGINTVILAKNFYPWRNRKLRKLRTRAMTVAFILFISTQLGGLRNWRAATKEFFSPKK